MAGYIGSKASVVSNGAERKKVFDITTTTTSLTGCSYTPNQVHVFHNGVRLVDGTDYTATDGSTVTLTTAAQSGDEVVVVSYATFQPADAYTKTESDGRYVNVTGDTMTGNLNVTNSNLHIADNTNGPDAALHIEKTTPQIRLQLNGNSGYNTIESSGFNELVFGRSGTEQVRIDSAGRVTMPYQPAFYAYQNAAWTIAAATWQQNINLNSTRFNTGGHFNTSNGTFTAPVAGDYLFTHTTYFQSNTTDYFYMGIYVNGSVYTYTNGFNDAISGVDNTRGGSVIIRLNANDAVTFWLYDGNGGTIGAGIERTHVSGRLLG